MQRLGRRASTVGSDVTIHPTAPTTNPANQCGLRAGREVFGSTGFNEATIVELAAAAEIGKGTFYLYADPGVRTDCVNCDAVGQCALPCNQNQRTVSCTPRKGPP